MILSTIAELENEPQESQSSQKEDKISKKSQNNEEKNSEIITNEKIFLENVKKRVLVLFEGLQSPKNDNIDIKLDITLNFLEFLLASIEERMKQIK